jgi:hypothetical protein
MKTLLIIFLVISQAALSQVQMSKKFLTNQKVNSKILEVEQKRQVNLESVNMIIEEDEIEKYLKGRIIVNQSIDNEGHIVITYDDSLKKKLSQPLGKLIEVITPDGRIHRPHQSGTVRSYTFNIGPPSGFSTTLIEKWMQDFSNNQMKFITETFKIRDIDFIQQESPVVKRDRFFPKLTDEVQNERVRNDYLYERIQYRSQFIEMMLKSNLSRK